LFVVLRNNEVVILYFNKGFKKMSDFEQERTIYSEILNNLQYELKFRLAEFDLLCETAESNDTITQLISERDTIKSKIEKDIQEIKEKLDD